MSNWGLTTAVIGPVANEARLLLHRESLLLKLFDAMQRVDEINAELKLVDIELAAIMEGDEKWLTGSKPNK